MTEEEWTKSSKTVLFDIEDRELEEETSFKLPKKETLESNYFFSSYNVNKTKTLKEVDITEGLKEYKKQKKKSKSLHQKVTQNLTCLNQVKRVSFSSIFSKNKRESEVISNYTVKPTNINIRAKVDGQYFKHPKS